MKFASFHIDGRPTYGAVDGEIIAEVTSEHRQAYADLRAAIASDRLTEIGQAALASGKRHPVGGIRLDPVIPNPDKIICVGLNYESHRLETKRPDSAYPSIFLRFADTQIGHDAPTILPLSSTRFDYEGELAVVIGKGGRYISEADALDHVAGYSCYNDVSVRDWQRHTHQFTPGKNFPATGPFGPFLVTPDEVGDLAPLRITTRLNGEVMQDAHFSQLIFSVPHIISYVSGFTELRPGDVIATGTPGGVGDRREPPHYMKAGDVVEVEIERVGLLRNHVEAEKSAV
ncbi:fumarylacetoacetate hydrolase family protein [Aquabacter sp. CN5-332]|uniref:fumarylacetoacetate hydrolase family protein n=1 Tax=Aquabacter sp. CN5-332 TaxID=3156608 RepID=UPI0032B5512E